MKKLSLKTLFVGLIPCLLIACGDPGADYAEEPGFGEEVDANQGGDHVDQQGELDDEPPVDEPVDEEPIEEEPEPFCGDGLIDDGEQCDDGNDEAGDGCSDQCEVEEIVIETEGDVLVKLTLDDLNSSDEPTSGDCVGVVDIVTNERDLSIDGQCFFPANFMDVSGAGDIDEAGQVTGELTFTLNGRDNVMPFTGTLEGRVLALQFFHTNLVVGSIRGIWDGTIDAELD